MTENLKWIQWVYPFAYFVGGLVAGVIFKRVVLARIKRFVGTTPWEGDDIIIDAARKFSIVLFVIGGLAVALALQETLANLFAGLHILVSRQVRPGDYVRLDSGEAGYVTDINWRNTTIRVLPNNMIIVPNSKLASAIITNFHQPEQEMSFLVEVGVSYDSDLKQAEQVTIDVAKQVLKEVQGGVPTFEPFIRYHTFADFSINFTVILRAKEFVDQYLLKHEFVKRLHERYKKEKIEIPLPIRTVHMRQT